jgi:hypothetical protein
VTALWNVPKREISATLGLSIRKCRTGPSGRVSAPGASGRRSRDGHPGADLARYHAHCVNSVTTLIDHQARCASNDDGEPVGKHRAEFMTCAKESSASVADPASPAIAVVERRGGTWGVARSKGGCLGGHFWGAERAARL